MDKITRKELIKKYIEFFKSKGHKEIPNASLIPANDPSVLFTTAGMHPIVPYLLGQPHPLGKRLTNVQRCIRTGDIDDVGDTYHHTLFEMLGNWSVGDYFKKEAIEFSFEFLTKILKIPLERFAVSVFAGDKDAPRDEEAAKTWLSLGVKKERIAYLPKENNWWETPSPGPCGPDTEMFYWKPNNKPAPKTFDSNDNNWVEIWNDVLMQYKKDESGKYTEAKQKNIDTGMGVERTVSILNNLEDNYLSDSFLPIIQKIEKLSGKKYSENEKETRHMRIIADHIKAAVFIVADGVTPSNTERGYVLRRLIRRAVRYGKTLGLKQFSKEICLEVFKIYDDYEELKNNKQKILDEIEKEETKFNLTLEDGLALAKTLFDKKNPLSKEKANKLRSLSLKRMEEIIEDLLTKKKNKEDYSIKEFKISEKEIDESMITAKEAFDLYQSFGFPLDLIIGLAIEQNLLIDTKGFNEEFKKHQELSRTASAGQFKSGLADNGEQTKKLHTATHLLNSALRIVLKNQSIHQKGSNITAERLRFDFNFDRKLTPEEIKQIEDLINEKIKAKLEVKREELSPKKAIEQGAEAEFGAKYPEVVSVYTIIDKTDKRGFFSKEICTGPHVSNTSELTKFKISKEESSAAGVRRIKAVLS